MTLDELADYGMHRMDDDEIESFLSSHSVGILGLPTEAAPYLLPMSYGYEGGSNLYFFYVTGGDSRKTDLSDQVESASFLVYSAETLFNWRSVLLTGTVERMPEEKRATLSDAEIPNWRPELFEKSSAAEGSHLYEFQLEEWTGISHTDLPPGFYQ